MGWITTVLENIKTELRRKITNNTRQTFWIKSLQNPIQYHPKIKKKNLESFMYDVKMQRHLYMDYNIYTFSRIERNDTHGALSLLFSHSVRLLFFWFWFCRHRCCRFTICDFGKPTTFCACNNTNIFGILFRGVLEWYSFQNRSVIKYIGVYRQRWCTAQ